MGNLSIKSNALVTYPMRNSNTIWKKSSKVYASGKKIFARKTSEATKEKSGKRKNSARVDN